VAFSLAQYAFADPHRVIAEDLERSDDEKRHFCFGEVGDGILTVRLTYRGSVIRIIGADTGGKARQFMSAKTQRSGVLEKANADSNPRDAGTKIKYTNESLGDVKVVRDFLPPPEQLAFREEGVKVTLALSKRSVEFFKSEATKHHTQYQRMIRHLVDANVDCYAPAQTTRSTRAARKRAAG